MTVELLNTQVCMYDTVHTVVCVQWYGMNASEQTVQQSTYVHAVRLLYILMCLLSRVCFVQELPIMPQDMCMYVVNSVT